MFFSILPTDWFTVGIIAVFLMPIVIIDLERFTIPNSLVLPGIAVLFGYYALTAAGKILPALAHGALAFFIILVFWFFSKKQIGLGDAKLSFFLAAGLGFFEWWGVLLVASFSAMMYGLLNVKSGRLTMKSKLPLAPFFGLGAGVIICLKSLLAIISPSLFN